MSYRIGESTVGVCIPSLLGKFYQTSFSAIFMAVTLSGSNYEMVMKKIVPRGCILNFLVNLRALCPPNSQSELLECLQLTDDRQARSSDCQTRVNVTVMSSDVTRELALLSTLYGSSTSDVVQNDVSDAE